MSLITQTFNFTGGLQSFQVPAGVCSITIQAIGAGGGPAGITLARDGASIQGDFAVTPGEILSVLVGGHGKIDPTAASGGGGGGSFVWRGSGFVALTSSSILIAAGGGGGAGAEERGTDASTSTTGNGLPGLGPFGGAGGSGGSGGQGGMAPLGSNGGGGAGINPPLGGNGGPGSGADSGLGGTSIQAGAAGGRSGTTLSDITGGFGGGGGSSLGGGGGGGGFSGGGGGSAGAGSGLTGGGGGGGTFINPAATNVVPPSIFVTPDRNGLVIITFTPTMITCPPNMTVSAPADQGGAIVAYQVPEVTSSCPIVSVSCTPTSGSFFRCGTTTVTCTTTDIFGDTFICTFTVTVNCLTPTPTIICSENINVPNTPGQSGAVVHFPNPTVISAFPATVSCTPASGSFFPCGTTIVNCTAVAADATSTCTFTVTVNCPVTIYQVSTGCVTIFP